MKEVAFAARASGRRITLISSNGNLHAGQASLIAHARNQGDWVILACVLNPLEFGPSEPLTGQARDIEADAAVAEAAGADVFFAPPVAILHPQTHSTFVEEQHRSRRLCGLSRPNHFRGFLTHWLKLAHCTLPHRTCIGHKDLQQAAVLRKAAADLFLDVEVEVLPTVRETDGLVLNWRNQRFTPMQRAEAAIIPVALDKARALARQGHRSVDRIVAEATHTLGSKRMIRVVYVQCIDPLTAEPAREVVPDQTVLALAVWVEETRLLDNCVL